METCGKSRSAEQLATTKNLGIFLQVCPLRQTITDLLHNVNAVTLIGWATGTYNSYSFHAERLGSAETRAEDAAAPRWRPTGPDLVTTAGDAR